MDELLKKLLAAEVLTEDTKKELETAFKTKIEDATKLAHSQATANVTADLNEKWITERDTLIEALDAKVSEVLKEEIEELREDIERFRDLEAEYAENLVEAKSQMAEELKSDISDLVEKLDAFLEIRLTAELEELHEDIAQEKKKKFGQTVFEAFAQEFKKHYADDDSAHAKLNESEARLQDALTALEETQKKVTKLERAKKLEEVLSPLSGRSREVMEAVLKNVDTPLLQDAYKTYIGRILRETTEENVNHSEKENLVLAEGKKETVSGVVKTGDNKQQLQESQELEKEKSQSLSKDERKNLQRLAGIQ